jgi:hypothetical protein
MPHLAAEPVAPPDDVRLDRDLTTGAVTLRAGRPPQAACAPGQLCGFAVYRVEDDAMSTGCELLGSARIGQPFVDATAQPGGRYTYFVTGLDRLWNESDFGTPQHAR